MAHACGSWQVTDGMTGPELVAAHADGVTLVPTNGAEELRVRRLLARGGVTVAPSSLHRRARWPQGEVRS